MLLRALVKVVEKNKYVGVSDWNGQFAFISWDKIIKSHPDKYDLKTWDEVYFILENDLKINWKEDNPQYFDKAKYKQSTTPAPTPIPVEFTQENTPIPNSTRPASSENSAIYTVLTKILQVLVDINRNIKTLGKYSTHNNIDLSDTFMEETRENIPKEKGNLPEIEF